MRRLRAATIRTMQKSGQIYLVQYAYSPTITVYILNPVYNIEGLQYKITVKKMLSGSESVFYKREKIWILAVCRIYT